MLTKSPPPDLQEDRASREDILRSRILNTAIGVVLAAAWLLFAFRHVESFFQTRQLAFLLFCGSETLFAGLFLFRRLPDSVSEEPWDWAVGIAGTAAPLFLNPGGAVVLPYGGQLIVIGVVFQVFAALSLGRSFAIVAANRTVKTAGMYRFVRHPMYASYVPFYVGYLLFNASLMNLGLVVLALGLVVLRIRAEEAHLSRDPTYREYMDYTRWRLLPLIY